MTSKRKRLWCGLLALAVLGVLMGCYVVFGGLGQSSLEAWIASRIKTVAADQLKPTLEFETLTYKAPFTVELNKVMLTADDPDRPGYRVRIIHADKLKLQLAELPREGQPLKLASVTIDTAIVHFIELEEGGLLGFSDLTKEPQGDEPFLLSDVLQISELTVVDTILEYDTREPGIDPMRIDQIDTVVQIDPDSSGVYGLDVAIDREGVFAIDLLGKVDLDAMKLGMESAKLNLTLGREHDHYLPPQIQKLFKKHELTGQLTIQADGEIDLNDAVASSAKVNLQLSDANGQVTGYGLPIEMLTLDAAMGQGEVQLTNLQAKLLGGSLDGSGSVGLRDAMQVSLNVSGEGLLLQQFLLPDGPGGSPSASGKVDLQVNASAPLQQLLSQMSGGGEIKLSDGRMARLPVISTLIAFLESEGEIKQIGDDQAGTDDGHFVFELRGNHAYLSQADIDASWYAMRGRGKFFFDGKVAMNINAGPLEKIQNALGAVGRVIGTVTDNVLSYRVRGEVGELNIVPVPLVGGIVGAPGDDESAEDFLDSTE